jgi:hypothetical protein
VQGNFIGTDVNGTAALGNSKDGVFISLAPNNTIGGTVAGARNIILGNNTNGVRIHGSGATGNAILGNSIYSNTGLGIDLGNDGVTANDVGDSDTGANNLQNFPVITSANTTTINGTLNSTANTQFTIQFFDNATVDPSGYGEGQTFLGSTNVNTDGSGNAAFSYAYTAVSGQPFITATATDPLGNTSEFSASQPMNTPPEITVLGNGVSIADGDTTPSAADHTDFGSVTEGGSPVSRTFTVRNDGTSTLRLGSVTIPAGFTLTEPLSSSLTLGEADTFTVRLDTAVAGVKSGDISFSTNDADEDPFNFRITGTVVAPEIDVEVNGTDDVHTHTFGPVEVGQSVSQDFTVRNEGNADLVVSQAAGLISPFRISPVNGKDSFDDWVITGGGTQRFTVSFSPVNPGDYSDTLILTSNDSDEGSYEIGFIGLANELPTLSIGDVSLAEGDSGTTSFVFIVSLSQASSQTVTVDYTTPMARPRWRTATIRPLPEP